MLNNPGEIYHSFVGCSSIWQEKCRILTTPRSTLLPFSERIEIRQFLVCPMPMKELYFVKQHVIEKHWLTGQHYCLSRGLYVLPQLT